jgi:3-methyladenine DNA glycosylase/8-oxoguanine DNA glycosylase
MRPRKTLGYSDASYVSSLMRLIETQSKPTIIAWCVDYAERHYLPIWEKSAPNDSRPRVALETARRWLRKEVKLQMVRDAAWDCHLAAKDAAIRGIDFAAAEAAARAIANAALTCHVATHSIRVAFYGAAAIAYDSVGVIESAKVYDYIAAAECARFEAALMIVAVENEPNSVVCKWSDMNNFRIVGGTTKCLDLPLNQSC